MVIQKLMNEASKKKNFMTRKGGALDEEIIALETHYKITLPDDYKEFLQKFGFALWFGDYICGLVEENTKFGKTLNVYRKTDYYHDFYDNAPEYQSVSNKGLIVNKYDGGGYYFLFSKESERAGEVGLFLTETFGQEDSTFASFTDYLSHSVTGSPKPVLANVDYDKINDILDK